MHIERRHDHALIRFAEEHSRPASGSRARAPSSVPSGERSDG